MYVAAYAQSTKLITSKAAKSNGLMESCTPGHLALRFTPLDQEFMLDTRNTARPARHTNRLADETSPYLLQHAHNPVDWFAWGEEAFAKARAEEKPIFLSVGYSTCYWCHVMERES